MPSKIQPSVESLVRDVVDAWRILGRLGLVDTIFNHISAAIEAPSGELRLIMNPEGRLPGEMTPEHVRQFPLKAYHPSEAASLGVNPDGLQLHSAIHYCRNRPGAIIHTHSTFGIAVGCTEQGLLPLSQTSMEFCGDIEMVKYDGVFRSQVLSEQLTAFARRGGVALLRNHGVLAVADSISEALYLSYYVEEACKIQVAALSQGVPILFPDKSVVSAAGHALRQDREAVAAHLFEAFRRTLTASGCQ